MHVKGGGVERLDRAETQGLMQPGGFKRVDDTHVQWVMHFSEDFIRAFRSRQNLVVELAVPGCKRLTYVRLPSVATCAYVELPVDESTGQPALTVAQLSDAARTTLRRLRESSSADHDGSELSSYFQSGKLKTKILDNPDVDLTIDLPSTDRRMYAISFNNRRPTKGGDVRISLQVMQWAVVLEELQKDVAAAHNVKFAAAGAGRSKAGGAAFKDLRDCGICAPVIEGACRYSGELVPKMEALLRRLPRVLRSDDPGDTDATFFDRPHRKARVQHDPLVAGSGAPDEAAPADGGHARLPARAGSGTPAKPPTAQSRKRQRELGGRPAAKNVDELRARRKDEANRAVMLHDALSTAGAAVVAESDVVTSITSTSTGTSMDTPHAGRERRWDSGREPYGDNGDSSRSGGSQSTRSQRRRIDQASSSGSSGQLGTGSEAGSESSRVRRGANGRQIESSSDSISEEESSGFRKGRRPARAAADNNRRAARLLQRQKSESKMQQHPSAGGAAHGGAGAGAGSYIAGNHTAVSSEHTAVPDPYSLPPITSTMGYGPPALPPGAPGVGGPPFWPMPTPGPMHMVPGMAPAPYQTEMLPSMMQAPGMQANMMYGQPPGYYMFPGMGGVGMHPGMPYPGMMHMPSMPQMQPPFGGPVASNFMYSMTPTSGAAPSNMAAGASGAAGDLTAFMPMRGTRPPTSHPPGASGT